VKQIKIITMILLLLSFSIPSFAAVDIDHLINVEMVNYNVPGAMVTVVKEGKLYYKNAFGDAQVITKTPMDVGLSVVQTGSVSKVLTTYALLNLLVDKHISVDDAIGPYLPEYLSERAYIGSLTFRNLLTHTTGIANIKADSATQEDPLKSISISFGDQAELFFDAYNLKPVIEKDTYTIFTNVGYILSGVLIESISGERYEYYMAENILRPLGMTTSSNLLLGNLPPGLTRIQNYSVFGGQRIPLDPFKAKHLPSDDFLTTVDDMTLLLKTFTSGDMDKTVYDALFTRQIANNALISGRSFGFSVVKYGDYEAYIHDGGIPGSNTRLLVIPEIKLGLFLTYNSNNLKARESLTNAVLSDLIDDFESIDGHVPYAIDDLSKFNGVFSPVNVSKETLEKLTRIIDQVRITNDSNGIKIGDDYYIPISETIFYSDTLENYAEFRTDENGQLEYLLVGNSIYERTPFFQSIIFEGAMLLLMALCNVIALLLLLTRWSNMKVNRIHDTPRWVLLFHSLAISGVLVFIFIISTRYDISNVIYGINTAVSGTKFFGYATLILSVPALIMIGRTKQDYRWSKVMIYVYEVQIFLGLCLVYWLFLYKLL